MGYNDQEIARTSSDRLSASSFVCVRTHVGCESSEWLGIKLRVLETKTSVHTVGSKLERHLLDIILYATDISTERRLLNKKVNSDLDNLVGCC